MLELVLFRPAVSQWSYNLGRDKLRIGDLQA
jgi:hypothetical protein